MITLFLWFTRLLVVSYAALAGYNIFMGSWFAPLGYGLGALWMWAVSETCAGRLLALRRP